MNGIGRLCVGTQTSQGARPEERTKRLAALGFTSTRALVPHGVWKPPCAPSKGAHLTAMAVPPVPKTAGGEAATTAGGGVRGALLTPTAWTSFKVGGGVCVKKGAGYSRGGKSLPRRVNVKRKPCLTMATPHREVPKFKETTPVFALSSLQSINNQFQRKNPGKAKARGRGRAMQAKLEISPKWILGLPARYLQTNVSSGHSGLRSPAILTPRLQTRCRDNHWAHERCHQAAGLTQS